MTLRLKILLLGLLAVAGIFLALLLQYRSYAAQSRSIEVVAVNVKSVAALSHAIHTLQLERGLTVVRHFTPDGLLLADLVRDTDAVLSPLAGIGGRIADLGESLTLLRASVSTGTTMSLAVLDHYSGLLQILIDEMGRLTRSSEAAMAKADISAHAHLVAAKEYLGQIRATLAYWIEYKRDEASVVTRLIRLKSLHEEALRKFGLEASPSVRDTFFAQFSGPQIEQMEKTLAQIVATGKLPRQFDVQAWWLMSTKAINHLKAVEDDSLASIEKRAGGELVQLRNAMRFGVMAALLLGLAVVSMAASATIGLIRSLNRVLASVEAISANQDFSSRIPASTLDEIGRIARSFNHLLGIAERLLKEKDCLASTDSLTGISNRLRFATVLGEEADRKRRSGAPMALIIFDIDHFKGINDAYGHNVGDEVLKILAAVVSSAIRSTDVFARWGGEEFVVLLRDDDCDAAIIAAEKLRLLIADTDFLGVGNVRCSFGVAAWRGDDTETSLVARADKALYQAKEGGRNRVRCAHGAVGNCRGRSSCAA